MENSEQLLKTLRLLVEGLLGLAFANHSPANAKNLSDGLKAHVSRIDNVLGEIQDVEILSSEAAARGLLAELILLRAHAIEKSLRDQRR